AGEDQRRAARKAGQEHQLGTNGQGLDPTFQRVHGADLRSTRAASCSRLELMRSPTFCALSMLMLKRSRFESVNNSIMPPRRANPAASLTVRIGCSRAICARGSFEPVFASMYRTL